MQYNRYFGGLTLLLLMAFSGFVATADDRAKDQQPGLASASGQSLPKSADYVSDTGTSVEDLLSRMSTNNLELQAARERLAQAEGRLAQAELWPNPRLEFQDKSDRYISKQGLGEKEMTLNQPLELFGKRGRRIDVARMEIERIRYEVADLERQRAAELATVIGQALSEASHLYSLERISELNESMRSATQLRIKAGDASRYEFAQVEAESARLESDRLRAANKLDTLVLQIKTLLGAPLEENLKLRYEPGTSVVEALSLDEAMSIASELRPDLKSAKLAEQVAEAKIRLAETGKFPDLGVIVGFKRENTGNPPPEPPIDWQLKFGMSIVLPAFNRNQGILRESVATLNEARLHRKNVEQIVRRDVTIAIKRLDQAQREVKIYEDRTLRLAQGNVRMARLGFEQGELRLADYVSEQRRLADVETAYTQARAELFQARVETQRAIGRPLGRGR